MKINWKLLFICIAIPLLVGGIAAYFTSDSIKVFESLMKPPLSPPGWLFPLVWTVLYILMGISSYLVISASIPLEMKQKAITLYLIQLLFNFIWSFLFFHLQLYYFAFIWLVVLWILILLTILSFSKISKLSAYLMIPYLLWVSFAGYLNLAIAILNA